ncbi:MAG: hypothetical protein IK093_05320 [Ruminiclostridium sp.]|nr:hypothetical protein [Ruminiclostridium sp.]
MTEKEFLDKQNTIREKVKSLDNNPEQQSAFLDTLNPINPWGWVFNEMHYKPDGRVQTYVVNIAQDYLQELSDKFPNIFPPYVTDLYIGPVYEKDDALIFVPIVLRPYRKTVYELFTDPDAKDKQMGYNTDEDSWYDIVFPKSYVPIPKKLITENLIVPAINKFSKQYGTFIVNIYRMFENNEFGPNVDVPGLFKKLFEESNGEMPISEKCPLWGHGKTYWFVEIPEARNYMYHPTFILQDDTRELKIKNEIGVYLPAVIFDKEITVEGPTMIDSLRNNRPMRGRMINGEMKTTPYYVDDEDRGEDRIRYIVSD